MILNYNGRDLEDATMQQLYEATGVDLNVVATDITRKELLVLNHRTAPDVPVTSAVRMSLNIPMLWETVIWRESWGPYMGVKIAGNEIVDGATLNNFPLPYILSKEIPFYDQIMGNVNINPNSIGFLLDEEQAFGYPTNKTDKSSFLDFLFSSPLYKNMNGVFLTMLTAHDRLIVKANKDRVIKIPVKEIADVEFDLPDDKIKMVWAKAEEVTNEGLKQFMALPKQQFPQKQTRTWKTGAFVGGVAGYLIHKHDHHPH